MSRVAKAPVVIPAGVEVKLNGQEITVKGAKGELVRVINEAVVLSQEENTITSVHAKALLTLGLKRVLLVR